MRSQEAILCWLLNSDVNYGGWKEKKNDRNEIHLLLEIFEEIGQH